LGGFKGLCFKNGFLLALSPKVEQKGGVSDGAEAMKSRMIILQEFTRRSQIQSLEQE